MKHPTLALSLLLVCLSSSAFGQSKFCRTESDCIYFPKSRRIFIEERITTADQAQVHCDAYGNCYGSGARKSRNVSLEATRDFAKRCADLTVTANREAADYFLRIEAGSSTLYNQAGDVAYVSPAKWKVSNLVKDVCRYVHDTSVREDFSTKPQ